MAAPAWTDNVSIIAAVVLSRGSSTRGIWDLRTKVGGYLFGKIGRGGTTALSGGALTAGLHLICRRVLNNESQAVGIITPGQIDLLGSNAAANSTTVNSDSNSGQAALNVASVTGFAGEDMILVQDSGGGVTRVEWARVAKTATGILTLDRNLVYTHTAAQADTVRNKADSFGPIWLDGGSLWECIFDYGDETAGESATVQALGQSWDTY